MTPKKKMRSQKPSKDSFQKTINIPKRLKLISSLILNHQPLHPGIATAIAIIYVFQTLYLILEATILCFPDSLAIGSTKIQTFISALLAREIANINDFGSSQIVLLTLILIYILINSSMTIISLFK